MSGPAIPESYSVFLSSFFTSRFTPEADGDYFVGKAFSRKGEYYQASPPVFWPVGGTLDFLALAAEDSEEEMARAASWHQENCTKGVEVTVAADSHLDSELMFGCADALCSGDGNVTLELRHCQSWLQFCLRTNAEDAVRVDSLVIENAYTGGLLRITNGIYPDAEWTFRGYKRKNVTVPLSRGLVLGRDESICNILLPEQDECNLLLYYSTKTSAGESWNSARNTLFRYPSGDNPWFYGIRTSYNIHISLSEIKFSTSVNEWSADSYEITVQEENQKDNI